MQCSENRQNMRFFSESWISSNKKQGAYAAVCAP